MFFFLCPGNSNCPLLHRTIVQIDDEYVWKCFTLLKEKKKFKTSISWNTAKGYPAIYLYIFPSFYKEKCTINVKNFIIEKINWVENKGNLQSLSSLSAFYLTMDRPLMTSILLLAVHAQSIFTVGQALHWVFYRTAYKFLSLKALTVITLTFCQIFSPYYTANWYLAYYIIDTFSCKELKQNGLTGELLVNRKNLKQWMQLFPKNSDQLRFRRF